MVTVKSEDVEYQQERKEEGAEAKRKAKKD